MLRAIALSAVLALPGLVAAQEIDERTAPFKQSGALDADLGPSAVLDSSFAPIPTDEVTDELLRSARVIDEAGERIGPITGLVYDATDQLQSMIVDVGGFLGVGDKPIRIDLAEAAVGRSEEYGETRVILPYSRDELQQMDPFPVR